AVLVAPRGPPRPRPPLPVTFARAVGQTVGLAAPPFQLALIERRHGAGDRRTDGIEHRIGKAALRRTRRRVEGRDGWVIGARHRSPGTIALTLKCAVVDAGAELLHKGRIEARKSGDAWRHTLDCLGITFAAHEIA